MKGFIRSQVMHLIGCMDAARKADGVCLSYPEYRVFIDDLLPGDYVLSRGGKGTRFLFMGTRVRPLATARKLSEQIKECQTAYRVPLSLGSLFPPQSGQAGAAK
jgi:hypothetical protein